MSEGTAGAATATNPTSTTRPKLYKIKDDLNEYFKLVNEHLVSTYIYDFYMELKPPVFRLMHSMVLGFGKIARLIFLHFLFYHTIWYFPLSTRSNNPFNLDYFDLRLAAIILYLNFYHVLVHKFFAQTLLFYFIRSFRILSAYKLNAVISLIEVLTFLATDVYLFYTLKFKCNLKLYLAACVILPHAFFKLNRYFSLNIMFFGRCVYRNRHTKENFSVEIEKKEAGGGASTAKYVYSDCSNIPISSYLNKKISTPNLYISTGGVGLSKVIPGADETVKVKHTILSHHYRSSKSNQTKTKMYSLFMNSPISKPTRLLSNLLARLILYLARFGDLFKFCQITFKNRAYTNSVHVSQGGSSNVINTLHISDRIQHKCDKDASNVRDEAEIFFSDFYNRLNKIISCTLETVYFSFVVVRMTVPPELQTKDIHFTIYTLSMTLSLFCAYFVYYMPLSYVMTHKRCADHLGGWTLDNLAAKPKSVAKHSELQKQQQQHANNQPIHRWQSTKVYYEGDRVVYAGKVYRVVSKYCASVPNAPVHVKYFHMFKDPIVVYITLCVLKCTGMVLMVGYLVYNKLWYAIVMNLIELGTNFPSYYMIFRDMFLLHWKNTSPRLAEVVNSVPNLSQINKKTQ